MLLLSNIVVADYGAFLVLPNWASTIIDCIELHSSRISFDWKLSEYLWLPEHALPSDATNIEPMTTYVGAKGVSCPSKGLFQILIRCLVHKYQVMVVTCQ